MAIPGVKITQITQNNTNQDTFQTFQAREYCLGLNAHRWTNSHWNLKVGIVFPLITIG